MKKKILLLLSFLVGIINVLNSQVVWAPIGATWFYSAPRSGNCLKIQVVKDTLLHEKKCRKLSIMDCMADYVVSNEYIYQSNDSIYYLNFNTNDFHILYDFSSDVGDSVIVHSNSFLPNSGFLSEDIYEFGFGYEILDTGSTLISGSLLKTQIAHTLHSSSWGSPYDELIIEKVGHLRYFFQRQKRLILEEESGICRCYFDSLITFKNPDWNLDCDDTSTGLSRHFQNNFLCSFYDKTLLFNSDWDVDIIVIYDILGRRCLQKNVKNKDSINIFELEKGIYLVKFYSSGIELYNYKILNFD